MTVPEKQLGKLIIISIKDWDAYQFAIRFGLKGRVI